MKRPKAGDLVEVHYLDLATDPVDNTSKACLMSGRCPGYFVGYRQLNGVRTLILAGMKPDDAEDQQTGWHTFPANLVRSIRLLR